jgi:L-lactate dehydrogenase complex protein LldG
MTVTRAEGDPLALAKIFGECLETVSGSYEVVADSSEVAARILERIRLWESESDQPQDSNGSRSREILSWDPDELPLPGIGQYLTDAGVKLFVPDDLHDDADRKRAGAAAIGLTGVDAAFAGTGSIVLAPAKGRSRAASLLPYRHIVMVPVSAVYPTVEAWLAVLRQQQRLGDFVRDSAQLAFVTGPSKSADIELNLTLGVHGPKQIHAIVFDDRL